MILSTGTKAINFAIAIHSITVKSKKMRTKVILLSTTVLLSAGATMHHFRYCPLQHMMSAFAHHKSPAADRGPLLTKNTAISAPANASAADKRITTAYVSMNPSR